MSARVFASLALTFTAGIAGGVVGSRLLPPDVPVPLTPKPAVAEPIAALPAAGGDGIADLVDRVKLAVVNIDTVVERKVAASPTDMFRFFFEGEAPQGAPQQKRAEKGVGSGFLVADASHGGKPLVVTNFHVVRGADKLTVTLQDGRKLDGKVVGKDPGTDLALVRIDAKGLPTLPLANPTTLRVGQAVIAVGSPLGLQQTVTSGILSAINRDISLNSRVGFLQTDAPINPGNSGGPLLNLKGEVIGVNTAIAARGQGIGFAVPVETLANVLPQLEAKGVVDRAWLGVAISNLPEEKGKMFYPTDHGVLVRGVDPKGPAAAAGLLNGDVILELEGKKLTSSTELTREVVKHPVGSTVKLLVSRQGQTKTIEVKLAKMPERVAAAPGLGQEDEDAPDGE